MIKKVLVTGGSGFIGSHLLDDLLRSGYKVVILDHSMGRQDRIKEYLTQVKVYYSDKDNLEEMFEKEKFDAIIHLATKYLKVHDGITDVESIINVNVKFPATLVDLAVQNKVKYFINTGTFFEFAKSDKPLTEESPTEAYNLYSASKLAFAQFLKFYSEKYDLKVIDFKLFAPFGDKDNDKLMALLVKTIESGAKLEFSGGEQSWNFTYVKDIAKAYICALKYFDKKPNKFLDVNVGYDKSYSIREVAKMLEEIAGKKLNIAWGANPYAKDEIFYANCDNTRLKRILGWAPSYDIKSGLKKTYDYFKEIK
jgi:UDP-glucose 4-epimerase